MVLQAGGSIDMITDTIHAHPTMAEGMSEVAEAAKGQCIHMAPCLEGRWFWASLEPMSHNDTSLRAQSEPDQRNSKHVFNDTEFLSHRVG